MPTLAQLISSAISISMFLLVFGLGLKTEARDLTHLLHRPGLLIRSILSMNVLMVLAVVALDLVFDMPRPIEIALIALAISPVPPVLPGKQTKAGGSSSYAIGLLVSASAVAVMLAPFTVALVGHVFGLSLGISSGKIASVVLFSIVVPLVLGIAVRIWMPQIGESVARPAAVIAPVLLVVAVTPVLLKEWPAIWALLGNGLALALFAFTLIGLAVGHFLGGPEPEDRTVLALATGTRHPGVAMAIAGTQFPDEKAVLAVVLCHLIFGALASFPYVRWRRAAGTR